VGELEEAPAIVKKMLRVDDLVAPQDLGKVNVMLACISMLVLPSVSTQTAFVAVSTAATADSLKPGACAIYANRRRLSIRISVYEHTCFIQVLLRLV
jgi:hypothetical protein